MYPLFFHLEHSVLDGLIQVLEEFGNRGCERHSWCTGAGLGRCSMFLQERFRILIEFFGKFLDLS